MARVTAPQQVPGAAPAGGARSRARPDRPARSASVRRLRRVPARLWWTSIAVLVVALVAISYAVDPPAAPSRR